ncbi:MAG: hypothetical protein K5893_11270 [Prevotella sp.]|nr:hypothetical protein [Prevotella sp.]
MKKIKFVLFAVASVFFLNSNAQTLSMDPIALGAGQTATVQIKVTGGSNIGAVQFTLTLPEGVRQVDCTSDANTKILDKNANAITYNANRVPSAPSTKSFSYVKMKKVHKYTALFDDEFTGNDGEWFMSFEVKNFSAVTATGTATFSSVMIGPNGAAVDATGDDASVVTSAESVFLATIASSGWSTICSAEGLDLSGVDAYIVTDVTKTSATLKKVTEAAAKEGLLINGAAGTTVSIPFKTGATTDGTNKLVGVTETTSITGDGTIFFLKGGEFVKAEANSSLGAGHAYLTGVPAGAKVINIVFDNPTAIQSVDVEQNENSVLYNLNGVRVDNPTKGVYIQNGRKVILK